MTMYIYIYIYTYNYISVYIYIYRYIFIFVYIFIYFLVFQFYYIDYRMWSQQQQIEKTGDADVASDVQIKIVLEELACMNVAKAGAQIFPHTLTTYYMKIKDEGPRIFTVEPCHFHNSGCMRGDDCRYSHLTCESAEAI